MRLNERRRRIALMSHLSPVVGAVSPFSDGLWVYVKTAFADAVHRFVVDFVFVVVGGAYLLCAVHLCEERINR